MFLNYRICIRIAIFRKKIGPLLPKTNFKRHNINDISFAICEIERENKKRKRYSQKKRDRKRDKEIARKKDIEKERKR